MLARTKRLKIEPEVSDPNQKYSMFNSGGVEVEVAEMLYGLVRAWRPNIVVETGTHLGISSAYIAQALEDNRSGQLTTYEVIPPLLQNANALWFDLDLKHRIKGVLESSLTAEMPEDIDFLFLDSEPQFRFDEFIRFWPNVKEGGLIAIHDLHPSLGRHGQTYHGVLDWPYGQWRPKLQSYITDFQVQLIHVPNPRGMVLFQKTRKTDDNIIALNDVY